MDETTAPVAGDPVVRYAPLVYLDPEERHFPLAAECFLANAELRWARIAAGADDVLAAVGAVDHVLLGGEGTGYSIDDDGRFVAHELTRPYDAGRTRVSGRRGFYLDVEDAFRFGVRPDPGEAVAGTPVYYEFVPGRYVTYWLFYGFSAPAGTKNALAGVLGHEGDWERVTVRLRGTEAVEVAYYQHGGPPAVVPFDRVSREGTHPIVFSARESHASYPTGGFHAEFADRSGRGAQWRTWRFLADASRQGWYRYGGAWGVVRRVPARVKAAAARAGLRLGDGEFTGPSGPCSKRPAPDGWLRDRADAPPGPGVCARR